MISVVIVCGGSSTRMSCGVNKVLLPLLDKPIFMHSLLKFKEFSDDVWIVANKDDFEEIKKYHHNVVYGGKTRQESVYNGVLKCKYNTVLIHDGARPFVSTDDITKIIDVKDELAFLGSYMIDSVKNKEFINLNREEFVLTYTPQKVNKEHYLKAYNQTSKIYTDDVSLVSEELNIKPSLVIARRDNTKITTDEDYLFALERVGRYRIGHSWDTHKLVSGRKLILGGVEIPFEKGLLGHSDADALLHAIAESLLGALALGDLGTHFPDNDPKFKGIDSKILLSQCYELVKEKGYLITNIDTMIYAEAPKMKPYIMLMREKISEVLSIDISQISIKATTYEKMDAIGRGEAIACDAVVMLRKTN